MKCHDIQSVVQNFGCPGHSPIQEVDSAHSNIEKVLKTTEVFNPVSLVRVLKSISSRRKGEFHVIQMRTTHFYDFQKCTITLKFGTVPYTQVKCLKYVRENEMDIYFKLSFTQAEYEHGKILGKYVTRSGVNNLCTSLPVPELMSNHKKPIFPLLKKRDITSMLKFMSSVDSSYYIARHLVIE